MSFDDMFSIKGKTALVTGGSKGIGEMIASGFVARGAKVYIVARNAENCTATASRISEEFGGECIAIQGDIVDMAGIEAITANIGQREDKLHILVNNAASHEDPARVVNISSIGSELAGIIRETG